MSCVTVLVLPYDVANSRGSGGGLNMDILWQIIFIVDAVFILVLVPYAFFFYESEQDTGPQASQISGCLKGQGGVALKYSLGFIFVFLVFILSMYWTIGNSRIPISRIQQDSSLFISLAQSNTRDSHCPLSSCAQGDITWSFQVNFPLYVAAFLCFIGWFVFVLFCGIGLVALPMDLINEYRTRPTPINAADYASRKLDLGRRAQELLEIAKPFQKQILDPSHRNDRKTRKIDRKTQNHLEASFYLLENEYKAAQQSYIDRGGNPIWYWFKLFLGICGACISVAWIIHIAIYVLPPKPYNSFLNSFFIDLEDSIPGFPLFGILFFGLFSFYLLWCAIKGNFRFGLRVPHFFKIFPMEVNNTMMNAFLFNTWLLLLCSLPVLQFCSTSFPEYARDTDADIIFLQVQYLEFFSYFFAENVFVIILLSILGVTIAVTWMCPKNKALEIEKKTRRIAAGDYSDDE